MKFITLKHLMINGDKKIGLQFYPDKVIQALIKQLPDVKWSQKFQMAHLPNRKNYLQQVYEAFRGVAHINGKYFYGNSQGKEPEVVNMQVLRKKYTKGLKVPENYIDTLERKYYALNTAQAYLSHFSKFMAHYRAIELQLLTDLEINKYLNFLTQQGKSKSYINSSVNSIKFYYEVVLGMPNRFYSVDRPRKDKKLPKVLSKTEIISIIENTNNIKHRCIVSLLYSAGLRRSELLNLKIADIDSKRMVINVLGAKGNKDRITLLGTSMLEDLRTYFKEWRPTEYLFEGKSGQQYSGTSVLQIVKKAALRAGIKSKVSPHIFRHSFASHLLEDGVDIRQIQILLGHGSIKTTEIYTHVSTKHIKSIKNLLD
jgi:integrase/recombinase XerD